MPDHKRLDQPDRSKSISTYSLEKMMFLSHPKKQVRFDFTSTKMLHVTQIFGEIHDSNAHVSRTFILVWLRLSFLFLLLDITAPQVRLSRPISSRDFKSDKILTSATAQQLNETIEGCRFNTGVCVRELSPHPATDAFVMGAHVLLKVHNTKKCCQKKTHHWYIWSQPISPVKIREDEKRIPRCDHQNRRKLKMCTYMMWHLKLSYVNCTWEWCLI